MKKWYKESYFDSNSWILENYDKLGLSSDETLLVLLINFYKKNRKTLTYELLCSKLAREVNEVDTVISSLADKHYLKISSNAKGLVFDIDSIYEFDSAKYELTQNNDVYSQIEEIFNKPLSPTELQKMNDLIEKYGQLKFMEAARIAEANRVLKMSYIEGVLRNEK